MDLKDRYINPLTDFGFKKLFGSERSKDLLIDFLNEVLPAKHQIADLSYTKNEHMGQAIIDRRAIFDLYCQSTSGDFFIVELQKSKQNYFKDRSVYYSTFPIREQAKRGDWDFKMTAVYTIGILDFIFDEHKGEDTIMHRVQLKDQHCRVFYDKLTYIYIELPKFNKKEQELTSKFDKWLYVFRHLSELENQPVVLQEAVFKKVFQLAEIAQFNPTERDKYEDSLKVYRDMNNVLDTAKEEGRIEAQIEVVKNGYRAGLSIEMLMKLTDSTKEEIRAIIEKIG